MCATATYTSPVAGDSQPSTLQTAGDALTTPSLQLPMQAVRWSRSCLAQWLVPSRTCLTRPVHHRAVFRLLGPQSFPLRRRRQDHKPLIHITLDTEVSYSNLHNSEIALKFVIENSNFAWIFSVKTGFSLLGRGQKSSEEFKLSRTNKTVHSKDFSFSFKERFPKHEHASFILGMLH